jgi:ferric-dicitrate binding protein FerR (iron transport regulator)
MDKDKIWSHISRKISGEDTAEDANHVDEWIANKSENKQTYNILKEIWNFRSSSARKYHSLFKSIKRRIAVHQNSPKQPFYTSTLFKAAAIIILILFSNLMVYLIQENTKPEQIFTWHEIVVPRGNRMKVILPDSSIVWLNNETKFKYTSDFGSNRVVELSGEAYFNVHHDSKHPFVVKIGEQQIKVLGTRFSVNAYPEDNLIETSLISGSVEFETNSAITGKSSFILEPGNSLFYNKQNNAVTQQKIQSSYYEYWENGMYAFKDESLESLSVKIKRIFNVEIVFEDDFLKSKTYTGTININDNIFIFMEAIRRTSVQPVEYKFNKNVIYVKLKK